jgi:tetratricopeptide (TPR) repeat protein
MSTDSTEPVVKHLLADKAVVSREMNVENLYMVGPGATPRRTAHNLPPSTEKIVVRAKQLKGLHRTLTQHGDEGVLIQAALIGPGGTGKTVLAVRFGLDHLAEFKGGVYFLDCNSPSPAVTLAGLADDLGVPPADSPERTALAVKRELESGEPTLLIFDNVLDNDTWQDWNQSGLLPGSPVRRLLTSQEHLNEVKLVHVGGVSRPEGVDVLAAHRPDARQRANKLWAEKLVAWFDGWVVGLSVTGAYMALNESLTWEAYYKDLESRPGLEGYRETESAVRRRRYKRRMDAVFDDLLGRLPADERRALEYAALLPEDCVVKSWLGELLGADGVRLPKPPGFPNALGEHTIVSLARRQLLVQRGDDGRVLSLHRVLRRHLSERLTDGAGTVDRLTKQLTDQLRRTVTTLDRRLTDYADDWELGPLVRTLGLVLPASTDTGLAQDANGIGLRLMRLARFREAKSVLPPALAILERVLGPDHPGTASSLNNLGSLLDAMGDLKGARPYLERALAIREKALGPDHPDTARSLSNVGALLDSMGDPKGARPYYERALAIREKALGPDHPDTATSLNNLGTLLDAMGDPKAARPYLERALAVYEKVQGPDHPDTARSLNNLGSLLDSMGDLKGARPYYERALAIREKALGPNHPDTARSLNNVGYLLQAQGDSKGARPYLERALAVYEKVQGPDHPDTARSLSNLGYVLDAMGDPKGACPYLERALAIREKALGPNHPDTATSLNNLGALLQAQGDLKGARPYYERALAIQEKVLGSDHRDTATSLSNLGALLDSMGDPKDARTYLERALAIREKALGPDHPDTARSLNILGCLLRAQRDLKGARPYYERALAIREKALGPDHPETATSMDNLGYLLQAEGDPKGARPYLERALAVYEKALGPDHPDTALSLDNLGVLLQAQGDLKGARQYFERALGVLERTLGPDNVYTATVRDNLHGLADAGTPGAG